MDTLKVTIHKIKNIDQAQLELPFDNGLYTIVGTNGCGKSTIMLCLAQLISNQLDRLIHSDACDDSYLRFDISNKEYVWKRYALTRWHANEQKIKKFNGLYEGSLFYGTRF